MSGQPPRRVNIASPAFSDSADDPDGFRSRGMRIGPHVGAANTGISIYELPPGQAICPYHYENPEEEWLLVLEGRPTLRHPGGEDELEPGDLVCFPEGPEGAHKVTNGTEESVRVMILSTKSEPAVAVYPDSDKIGVWPGNEADEIMIRRESDVDYWDREL
jgi:uncharacterized cupin superfamily protein